jgi:hypothetical protein
MSVTAIALIWGIMRMSVVSVTRFPTMSDCDSTFAISLGPVAGVAETTSAGDMPGASKTNWTDGVVVVFVVFDNVLTELFVVRCV